ncbi:MAG: hypothetical protein H7Y38_04620 [Armatimonadetes bacterium]|nr:hypothetical protein [Armatimonadota bacterium]
MNEYHAMIGRTVMSTGKTVGDAVGSAVDMWEAQGGVLSPSRIFFKQYGGDEFFSDDQIARMKALFAKRNAAWEQNSDLGEAEQNELETLVNTELDAQARRLTQWMADAGK